MTEFEALPITIASEFRKLRASCLLKLTSTLLAVVLVLTAVLIGFQWETGNDQAEIARLSTAVVSIAATRDVLAATVVTMSCKLRVRINDHQLTLEPAASLEIGVQKGSRVRVQVVDQQEGSRYYWTRVPDASSPLLTGTSNPEYDFFLPDSLDQQTLTLRAIVGSCSNVLHLVVKVEQGGNADL